MDTSIIAALISGTIAVFVSLLTARWQIGIQKKELDIKTKQLDASAKQLLSELEALRQTQFTEILKKRLNVYPTVWATVTKYTLQWRIENKLRDHAWAKEFLSQLNIINNEAGVYFSQAVYERFDELRRILIYLEGQLAGGKHIDILELYVPDNIFIGFNGEGGLATFLKDDLGSYRDTAIQARDYAPKSRKYISVFDEWYNSKPHPTQDLMPPGYEPLLNDKK